MTDDLAASDKYSSGSYHLIFRVPTICQELIGLLSVKWRHVLKVKKISCFRQKLIIMKSKNIYLYWAEHRDMAKGMHIIFFASGWCKKRKHNTLMYTTNMLSLEIDELETTKIIAL